MKKLEINQMEGINGYGWWSGFCRGFGAAQAVWGAGILAGAWTPPGAAAAAVIGVIDVACIVS